MTGSRLPLAERFAEKVNKESGLWFSGSQCWLWLGSRPGGSQYGDMKIAGRMVKAHRVAYELFVGEIPDGRELDHLCRNRGCVNPAHLEPVPSIVNLLRGESFTAVNARKTHCTRGHPFDERNTYRCASRKRHCRTCRRERNRECARKKREAAQRANALAA